MAMIAALVVAAPSTPATAAPSAESRFESVDPVRVVDTRATGKVQGGATVGVPLAGRVPAGATAVVLNLTATDPEGFGYVTAYAGATRPSTSNANTDELGETAANLVVVSLANSSDVKVFASVTSNLVIDLLGWFVPAAGSTAGRYRPVAPATARILDTRTDPGHAIALDETRKVAILGRAGVPSSGVRAVALNVTIVDAASAGWLQVIATGGTTPIGASSNVNVTHAGQTVANLVMVPVGSDGSVTLGGTVVGNVLIDVAGWFTDTTAASGTDGLFVAVDPTRLADSRAGAGGPVAGGAILAVNAGVAGVDLNRIGAVLANLTLTGSAGQGYVTGYSGVGTAPNASNINADKAGATVANAGIIATSGSSFALFSSTTTHLVVDLLGWFTKTVAVEPPAVNGQGSIISSVQVQGGYKVLYRSIGAAGSLVQEVTLAYVPSGTPPAGGWPIMALLHGPYGMGDQCAVSANPGQPSEVMPWLAAGYAVVFPDLEGIGVDSPGDHPYMHGPATGRSVLDAVRAARSLFGASVSNKVVTWGFSSGAHGSLWVGEMAPEYAPELDMRGVISLDPVSVLSWQVSGSWQQAGFPVWWVQGQKVANPALNYSDVLKPAAIALLPQLNAGCLNDAYPIFDSIPGGPLFVNPMTLPLWAAAFEASDPGTHHSAPVFLAGGTDFTASIPAFPHDQHQHYMDRACALGTSVHFQAFPGGHMGMLEPAVQTAAIAWLDTQLHGTLQTGCNSAP
jgi:hypothetical protein